MQDLAISERGMRRLEKLLGKPETLCLKRFDTSSSAVFDKKAYFKRHLPRGGYDGGVDGDVTRPDPGPTQNSIDAIRQIEEASAHSCSFAAFTRPLRAAPEQAPYA